MLTYAEHFDNMPVMSLQTGSELARASRAIINPHNLSIIAYELDGRLLDQQPSLLRIADIRETGALGMIVDSADEIVSPDDIIDLKKIYEYQFDLQNKAVVDEKGHRIGKVIGYTMDTDSFIIQQLRVKRPLLRSLGDVELLVHRSQIIKVSDDIIVIKSASVPPESPAKQLVNQGHIAFENPFRKNPQVQPESIK